MRSSVVFALSLLAACSRSDDPTATKDETAAEQRSVGKSSRFGTARHESVDATLFVGEFTAPNGDVLELRADSTYEARLDGWLEDGTWYAFGGHLELRSNETNSMAREFDLVGVEDELLLVPDWSLARFVVEVRSGIELSRDWLRRSAKSDDRWPGLPPPFDAIATLGAPEIDVADWRGSFRAHSLERGETLDIDEHARFKYERHGCWIDTERAVGDVIAYGNLLLLTCDADHASPHLAARLLFAPIRRGARRYLVACDDVRWFARMRRASANLVDHFYLRDDAEPHGEAWNAPAAFASWFSSEPMSASVLRVAKVGPGAQRVPVVTLDVGRARGVFRGLWFSALEGEANKLRVVVARESDCDAVWLDHKNDGLLPAIGAGFTAAVY